MTASTAAPRAQRRAGRGIARLALFFVTAACHAPARGGLKPESRAGRGIASRPTGAGRPPLRVIEREGDAQGALAVAVVTEGIASHRGALVGVALATLVQERLAARGINAVAIGGWNGWRLRMLAESPDDVTAAIAALRASLLTPVAADEHALPFVARKAAALAARPVGDVALIDSARCTGEAFGSGVETPPSALELEGWRGAAHGLGRLAFSTVGVEALADAAAHAIAEGPPWPTAAEVHLPPWPSPDGRAFVYDASGQLAPGGARIVVTVRTPAAERAVAAAEALADPRGALASRLEALEAPAHLRSVVATAHVDGGCLAVVIDLGPRDLGTDAPARLATAAALARQEIAVEVADVSPPPDLGGALALRASDPRDAAERAAWWSLVKRRVDVDGGEPRIRVVVGIATGRDVPVLAAGARAEAIRGEIDRATLAAHSAVVEAHTRVERGQGEVWLLLASPCGTLAEGVGDAGVGAAVAWAAAAHAAAVADDAKVEPFIDADGIGVLIHGPARRGETPPAHARRLADIAARAFASDALETGGAARARAALLAQASSADARLRAILAGALAPLHPSWNEPLGTLLGLSSASDETVAMRAAAARAGPLRVAVLANVDEGQADAGARAVDRWIARRVSEARTCPPRVTLAPPRAGTYYLDRPAGTPSEALVAVPLATNDPAARLAAIWLAAALNGSEGLLGRALSIDSADGSGRLAQKASADVVGWVGAPAMVVRVTTSDDAELDAAVAQVRGLLDRIRMGALRDEDRIRAAAVIARVELAASLDPRERTLSLWRAEPAIAAPSLLALRGFAASALRDEALIIVASRPPRDDLAVHPITGREKLRSREP